MKKLQIDIMLKDKLFSAKRFLHYKLIDLPTNLCTPLSLCVCVRVYLKSFLATFTKRIAVFFLINIVYVFQLLKLFRENDI